MVIQGGKNARSKRMSHSDLIKILIDRLEQLIRENEQLRQKIRQLESDKK